MRKKIIVIIAGIVLLVSAWVGTASAQDIPGYPAPGYPVETETPPPTEAPTKPPENSPTPPPSTPDPTQPPQPEPTDAPPTWVPAEPTPTPDPVCPFQQYQPVLLIISEEYGVPYDEVADLFCNSHMGVGEILKHLERLENPEGYGGLGHLPGHGGRGWGLYWRAFNPYGHPGIGSWLSPS